MNARTDRAAFLRRSLQLDGIASGLCGVLLLAAASPVSALIGLAEPAIARVVGALLVVYAAALLYNGARATVSRAEAVGAVVFKPRSCARSAAGWVIGSAGVLAGPLTPIGNLAVAAAVLLFAVLEVVGLTRRPERTG